MNLLSWDWVSSVQFCSFYHCFENEKALEIFRSHTGPVTLNGYDITPAKHHQALKGKAVLINSSRGIEKQAVLTASKTDMMIDGKSVFLNPKKSPKCVRPEPMISC